jgi:TatA/E family protein of Tat protein translocase
MPLDPWLIVVVLLILVFWFGAGRLTQISGAFGRSVREFRSAVNEDAKPAAPATPAIPPVNCPACQAANAGTNKFCSSCGAAMSVPPSGEEQAASSAPGVPVAEAVCPSCATVNPPGQAFCGQCGTRLARAA